MYPHHCRFIIRTDSDEVWYKSPARVEIIQISTPRQPFPAPRSFSSTPMPVHCPMSEHPSTAPRAAIPSPALLFFDADARAPPHVGAPVHQPLHRRSQSRAPLLRRRRPCTAPRRSTPHAVHRPTPEHRRGLQERVDNYFPTPTMSAWLTAH